MKHLNNISPSLELWEYIHGAKQPRSAIAPSQQRGFTGVRFLLFYRSRFQTGRDAWYTTISNSQSWQRHETTCEIWSEWKQLFQANSIKQMSLDFSTSSHRGSGDSLFTSSCDAFLGSANSYTLGLDGIEDPRRVLPTSPEYDSTSERLFFRDMTDRSDWHSRLLAENPEIRDFEERVDPVSRASAFGRMYLPTNRLINHPVLLALISQHLRTIGLVDSQSSLHAEWSDPLQIPSHMQWSQLNLIVQRGIERAERFWELGMDGSRTPETASELLDEEISRTIGGTPHMVEDDTPLASEKFRDERFLRMDDDGSPAEASLNQIILMATSDEGQCGGPLLIPAICLTYKSFTTSKILFTKIRERFRMAFAEEEESQRVRHIALTFKFFKAWLKDIDNIEQPVLDAMRAFVETELRPRVPSFCSNLFTQKPRHDMMDYSKAPKVELGMCKNLWIGEFSLFDIPPVEFARQLTIMSSTRYYAVSRNELLDNAWQVPRLKHRAPNICALTDFTNRMCEWVQTTILTENSLSKRLSKMRFLIEVMAELEKMRNFFDLCSIFGGFNAQPIFRLNQHKARLPVEMQELLERVAEVESPLNNYANARQWHQTALNTNQPVLPHLPVLLGDIFKYNDGTKAMIDGLVNLRKCYRMLKLIRSFEDFKHHKYCFLPIEQVARQLEKISGMEEDALMELSYDVEPMDATPSQLKDTG